MPHDGLGGRAVGLAAGERTMSQAQGAVEITRREQEEFILAGRRCRQCQIDVVRSDVSLRSIIVLAK